MRGVLPVSLELIALSTQRAADTSCKHHCYRNHPPLTGLAGSYTMRWTS
jgi:hypothetical protein